MTALIALDADQLAALDSLATAKKKTREAASHADRTAAYAALKEFDRNPKDVRAAAAAKAKADADVAKAQAAVAVARAALAAPPLRRAAVAPAGGAEPGDRRVGAGVAGAAAGDHRRE